MLYIYNNTIVYCDIYCIQNNVIYICYFYNYVKCYTTFNLYINIYSLKFVTSENI